MNKQQEQDGAAKRQVYVSFICGSLMIRDAETNEVLWRKSGRVSVCQMDAEMDKATARAKRMGFEVV